MTCDKHKPWQNSIFGDLIQSQWWGLKGDAKRLSPSRDNVYNNVPIAMLALVCTLTGLPIKGNLDFNDGQYRARYASPNASSSHLPSQVELLFKYLSGVPSEKSQLYSQGCTQHSGINWVSIIVFSFFSSSPAV